MSDDICVIWPDAVPSERLMKQPNRFGAYTYSYPAYHKNYIWYFVATCDCGHEMIMRRYTARRCFNCRRIHEDAPRQAPFDRHTHCRRGAYQCKHYADCLSDLALYGFHIPQRFVEGECYTETLKELYVTRTTATASLPEKSY